MGFAIVLVLLTGAASATGSRQVTADAQLAPAASSSGNNGVTPPPTVSASGAYDAADGYVLMFGGWAGGGSTLSTTWVFTRGNWSELTVVGGIAPPARFQAQMAYDTSDGYVVLFGGCADPNCHRILSDTWSFTHGQWTNLTSRQSSAPPGRDRGMMAYDGVDGYVLLFGGEQPNRSAVLNDAWSFHAGLWASIAPTRAGAPIPTARMGAAMVYDAARNLTVLFGGVSSGAVVGDTWTYRAGNWTDVSSQLLATPDPRYAASATYDSEDHVPLLVDGYSHGSVKSDAWAFTGSTWTQLSASGGPPGSFGGLLVDDPGDGYVLYFSGVTAGNSFLTSTLLYDHGGWVLLINPPGSSFPLLSLLIPLILFPLFFGILFPITAWARRRRERQLAAGVNIAPGEVVQWIETQHPMRLFGGQLAGVFIFLIFPLAIFVPLIASGTSLQGTLLVAGIFGTIYGLLGVALFFGVSRSLTRAVGIVSGGVIVRRKSGELRVAWDNLQPSMIRPQKGRYWFQFLFPGKEQGVGGFGVSVEQARAILLHPSAPPWVVPRVVSDGLNIPPRAAAPLRSTAGPDRAPSVPYAAPGPPPPPPGWVPAAPPPVSADWAYPTAAPPPGPPPPPPARLRGAVLPRGPPPSPPPGTTACPSCGQLNPSGRVAFCRSCGRRLV